MYPVDTPFDIPDSWEWVRFKDLVDYSMGKTPPRKETEYWSNGTLPWVSIADLVADGTVTATKECVNSFAAENTFKGKISKAGTLLMSFKLTVGKVSILGIDAFHNEAIISIYPFVDPDKITTMFLFATLPLLSQSGDTKSAIKGNTLNSDSLDALLIPLPPIMEQKRIFDKLHELTTPLLDYGAAEQKVTELNMNFPERLKKSILQEAVQGKLVSQDPSDEPAEALLERIRAEKQRLIKEGKIKKDKHESVIFRRDNSHYEKRGSEDVCIDDEVPFEIPSGWSWARLGTCLDVRDGTHDTPRYVSKGVPLVTSKNLSNGRIDFSTAKLISKQDSDAINQRSKVDSGDIMYAMIGSIGNPVLYRGTDEFSIKNMALFKCVPDGMYMEYVYWFLVLAQEDMKKAASGGVQAFVSLGYLRNYLIPVPPIAEQKRICNAIEQVLPLLAAL